MRCRHCKNDGLPDHALFCPWCGKPQTRQREKKSYPKPRVLADGTLLGQLMVDGQRVTVKARHEKEYHAKVDALREHVLDLKEHPDRRLLKDVVRAFIDKNDGVLSPSTLRGYEYIYRGRFTEYMSKEIGKIDYQRMVNDESKLRSPKTVKNAWALIASSLSASGITVPSVNLPKVPESNEDFLDYEEIQRFLAAVRGDPVELAAILALHSLRMSEILGLSVDDISNDQIHVRGATVRGIDGMVNKATNKNRTSMRDVPIMISRLTDILPTEGRLVTMPATTIASRIERACKKAGVTVCTPHDLRRSFASLGYRLGWSERAIMAVGGWSTMNTVHRVYIKLSQDDIRESVEKMKNYYEITTVKEKDDNSNEI